ncbi:MAG: tyrosine-type recombinase/integrase [Candidatus Melainabacteria bacterium]|nr:tyrosine-type recombinase/integrase [Candidatus Melainabacteria bacterium]
MGTLQNEVARDFLLFLLLPGMRFGETRKLKWCHVDFENKILIVPRELTKSDREHRLPLSDFLVSLLKKRYIYRNRSEWVFQSVRLKNKHLPHFRHRTAEVTHVSHHERISRAARH